MAKTHSSLTGADLHNPKGIGSENTSTALIVSQSTQTISVSGSVLPNDANIYDLGSASKFWKDIYVSSGSIKFVDPSTNNVVSTIGLDADGNQKISGSVLPDADDTYDLGSSTKEWKDLYIDGTAYLDSATITAGTITGITDLVVADGGTGAGTFTDGGILIGSGTGAITAAAVLADGEILIGDGTTDPVALDIGSSTSITILGTVATGTWQGTAINQTYLTGQSGTNTGDEVAASLTVAGVIEIATTTEVNTGTDDTRAVSPVGLTAWTGDTGLITVGTIATGTWEATDVAVAHGGTGVSTLTDGGVLLGNGTGGIVAMSVLADSEMIVGDGTTDPVAESGATLRTSIGVGTTDDVQFANITGSAVSASVGKFTTIDIDGGSITGITDLAVADGGTGASSLNNLITMGTHTAGNYVATITGGTGITSTGATSGETIAHSLSVDASQTQITGVGTVTTGVWNSTFGATANSLISGSIDAATGSMTGNTNITTVGTIGTGTWEGTTVAVLQGGTGVTTKTGTGNVVLSTSPTLVTPVLGTPTSGTATNITGLPIVAGTTGTLSVARGGTGVTAKTGTTNVVLSNSPTLVTPALGTPSALVGTNISGTASSLTTGKTTVTDSTANTAFPIILHDESNALLDDTGTFTYNPSTSTLVVPNINVSGTQTFVNTANLIVTSSIIFEGATADAYETTLTIVDPTADRTITLPNSTDTVALLTTSQTFTSKSIDLETNTLTGTLAEFNAALQSESFVSLTGTETLTNKTLTTPTIASFTNSTHTHADAAGGGQITLGTGTTGNYVSTIVAGDGIDVSGATGDVTVTVEDSTALNKGSVIVAGGTGITVGYSAGTATVTRDALASGDIPNNAADTSGKATTAGTADLATLATTITITDNESTVEENAILFSAGADIDGGSLGVEQDHSGMTYNPSTGGITATLFTGGVTGNASTATALATGRTIAMTGDVVWTSPSFDGTGNVTAAGTIQANAVQDGMVNDDVATGLAGTGTTATSGVLNVIGGNGITANANDVAVTAAQTTITGVHNAALQIGRDSHNEFDFSTDNVIKVSVNAVDDEFRFSAGGTFHADADIVAYSSTVASDRKLKTNITDTKYGLSDVLKLRGVDFNWKEKFEGKRDVGFIAQEVQEIIPELVKEVDSLKEEGETHLTVDYSKVVPVLIEAIKEQQKQIDELKKNKMNKRIKE